MSKKRKDNMYGGGGDNSAQMRTEQEAREAKIRSSQKQIDTAFAGFDPSFYKAREKAYVDFAFPQLGEQYSKARNDLVYNLANKGLLRSNSASTMTGSLAKEMERRKQGLADQAMQEANNLRSQVERQRSDLVMQAQSGLEPSRAYSQALSSAQGLSAPSSFAPVGQMFSDWANIYRTKQVTDTFGGAGKTPSMLSSKESGREVR